MPRRRGRVSPTAPLASQIRLEKLNQIKRLALTGLRASRQPRSHLDSDSSVDDEYEEPESPHASRRRCRARARARALRRRLVCWRLNSLAALVSSASFDSLEEKAPLIKTQTRVECCLADLAELADLMRLKETNLCARARASQRRITIEYGKNKRVTPLRERWRLLFVDSLAGRAWRVFITFSGILSGDRRCAMRHARCREARCRDARCAAAPSCQPSLRSRAQLRSSGPRPTFGRTRARRKRRWSSVHAAPRRVCATAQATCAAQFTIDIVMLFFFLVDFAVQMLVAVNWLRQLRKIDVLANLVGAHIARTHARVSTARFPQLASISMIVAWFGVRSESGGS